MSAVLGSSVEYAIDLVSDDEVPTIVPRISNGAEQSVSGRTYVTRASARRAQIAPDVGTQGRPADTESRLAFRSKAQSTCALATAATTTTLPSPTLDHRTRRDGRDGQCSNADQGIYLGNRSAVQIDNTGVVYHPTIRHAHAELSDAAIAANCSTQHLNVESSNLLPGVQRIRSHTPSLRSQTNTVTHIFGTPSLLVNLPSGHLNGCSGGGREADGTVTQQSTAAISMYASNSENDTGAGKVAPPASTGQSNLPGDRSSAVAPAWGASYASTNIGASTDTSLPREDVALDYRQLIENSRSERNMRTALADASHNRRTALVPRSVGTQFRNRRNRGRFSGPDVVELRSHKLLEPWKKKLAQEFHIEEEMTQLNAAVSLFDRQNIQTVVPNRYLKETSLSSKKNRPRHSKFPGKVEVLTEQPMSALRKAYSEHAAVPDPSRLVLWTDGSASARRRHVRSCGFAVTWRRATDEGTWGGWEAAGFQVQGEKLDACGMETLAVMKAVVKALELVRQMPGRIKTVAIYTDSTSTLSGVQTPRLPLSRLIVEKARLLTQLGPKISLHWCPGHSKVPGNELADKIAGMARSHVYGESREVVDLSDDEDEDDDD